MLAFWQYAAEALVGSYARSQINTSIFPGPLEGGPARKAEHRPGRCDAHTNRDSESPRIYDYSRLSRRYGTVGQLRYHSIWTARGREGGGVDKLLFASRGGPKWTIFPICDRSS